MVPYRPSAKYQLDSVVAHKLKAFEYITFADDKGNNIGKVGY